MLNDREIDEKNTFKNVREFLGNKLDRYLAFGGQNRFNLKSPRLEPTGIKSRNGNTQERAMILVIESEKIVYCVGLAISQCTDTDKKPYKTILTENYINDLQFFLIPSIIGYSVSQTRTLKRRACIEFAEKFLSIQQLNGVATPIDLISYKN